MKLDRIGIDRTSPDPERLWQLGFERNIWAALSDTTNLVLILVANGRNLDLVLVLGRVWLLVLNDMDHAFAAAVAAVVGGSVAVETCEAC